jgi:hypothetical protein
LGAPDQGARLRAQWAVGPTDEEINLTGPRLGDARMLVQLDSSSSSVGLESEGGGDKAGPPVGGSARWETTRAVCWAERLPGCGTRATRDHTKK